MGGFFLDDDVGPDGFGRSMVGARLSENVENRGHGWDVDPLKPMVGGVTSDPNLNRLQAQNMAAFYADQFGGAVGDIKKFGVLDGKPVETGRTYPGMTDMLYPPPQVAQTPQRPTNITVKGRERLYPGGPFVDEMDLPPRKTPQPPASQARPAMNWMGNQSGDNDNGGKPKTITRNELDLGHFLGERAVSNHKIGEHDVRNSRKRMPAPGQDRHWTGHYAEGGHVQEPDGDVIRGHGGDDDLEGGMGPAIRKGLRGALREAQDIPTVYHGTDADFERPSVDRLGAGSGLGWGKGFYASEDEGVARYFRDRVAYKHLPEDVKGPIYTALRNGALDIPTAVTRAIRDREDNPVIQNKLKSWVSRGKPTANRGFIYQMDMLAEPDRILDFEAPFGAQNPSVRKAVRDLSEMNIPEEAKQGSAYWRVLQASPQDVTDAGIDAMRFREDLPHRANNWTVFDPSVLDIKNRYSMGGPVKAYFKGGGVQGRVKDAAPDLVEEAGALKTLSRQIPGKPNSVKIPDIGEMPADAIKEIDESAEAYMRRMGMDRSHVPQAYEPFDEARAGRIAEAFDRMKHDPQDPAVRRSYDAMIDETMAQYRALEDAGVDVRFLKDGMSDPYARSPSLGYHDLIENGRLYTFPTDFGFGTSADFDPKDNPLLKGVGRVGDKDNATANDAFRVVHDLYGHFGPGNPFFRHQGEERAWVNHSRMYSDDALPAMTTETRGQNSWLNFGPFGEHNRKALGADTVFADQKVNLLPPWAYERNDE